MYINRSIRATILVRRSIAMLISCILATIPLLRRRQTKQIKYFLRIQSQAKVCATNCMSAQRERKKLFRKTERASSASYLNSYDSDRITYFLHVHLNNNTAIPLHFPIEDFQNSFTSYIQLSFLISKKIFTVIDGDVILAMD